MDSDFQIPIFEIPTANNFHCLYFGRIAPGGPFRTLNPKIPKQRTSTPVALVGPLRRTECPEYEPGEGLPIIPLYYEV